MQDYLLNKLCSYPENSTIGTHVKFLILVKSSMNFTLFHEGQNKSSSRVRDYVINDQNTLTPYIFWKPRMSPIRMSGLFLNI
jgi:hypothetical protein